MSQASTGAGVDYQLAFELAPVGLALSRNRTMVDCNRYLCEMFGASRELLVGQSFQVLYPSAAEFERTGSRIAPILNRDGTYADDPTQRHWWTWQQAISAIRAGDTAP